MCIRDRSTPASRTTGRDSRRAAVVRHYPKKCAALTIMAYVRGC